MSDEILLYDIPLLDVNTDNHIFITFTTTTIVLSAAVLHIDDNHIDIPLNNNALSYDITEYLGKDYTLTLSDADDNIYEFTGAFPQQVAHPTEADGLVLSAQDTINSYILGKGYSTITKINLGSGCSLIIPYSISTPSLVLNTDTNLNAYDQITTNSLFVSSDVNAHIGQLIGTIADDDIYIGKNSNVTCIALNMQDGYDTAYVAGGATLRASSITNLDSLNIAFEGRVLVDTWNNSGSEDGFATIKVGSYAYFKCGPVTGGSVDLTLNSHAYAVIGNADINKLTVQDGAMLKTGSVTATAEDNFFSMSNGTVVINGIDFGAGNDTLTWSSSTNLILTGEVDGLEHLSVHRHGVIFVTEESTKSTVDEFCGQEIAELITFYKDLPIDESIQTIQPNTGRADLFLVEPTDTYTVTGVMSIMYFDSTTKTWLETTDQTTFTGDSVTLIKVTSTTPYTVTRKGSVTPEETPIIPSRPIITVTSPVSITGHWGRALDPVQLTASITDHSTLQFQCSDLPEGLELATTGVLSGTPRQRGTFAFYVIVSSTETTASDATIDVLLTIDGPDIDLGDTIAEALVLTASLVKQLKTKQPECEDSESAAVDLSQTTATAEDVLSGKLFYSADGILTTGTLEQTTGSSYDVNNELLELNDSLASVSGTNIVTADIDGISDINAEMDAINNRLRLI